MTVALEHDLHAGCAYCGRVARDLVEEGDDLVCAPGTGCVARPARSRRRPGVVRTKLVSPVIVQAPRDRETCRCGHTHATNPAVWQELSVGGLVALCPGCAS